MDNIKNIVDQCLRQLFSQKVEEQQKIEHLWKNILEENERIHTSIQGFKKGFLWILVDSPAVLYHMQTKKNNLLKQIQKEVEGIKDIYFQIGTIHGQKRLTRR